MKLSVKISSLVVLVSLIPAITVLSYTLWTIKEDRLQAVLQDVLHRVELSAERLASELDSTQREVELYAQMDELKGMKPQQFIPFLTQEVIRHSGRYEKFIVGTTQGHFYNTSGGNPEKGMLRTFDDNDPAAEPKNIRQRDYWQGTVGNNYNATAQSAISSPMISYTTGARQIVIASAIVDEGELKGMVGAAIDWDRIVTLIRDIQSHQFLGYSWAPKMFLMSRDGAYWYHWDPRRIAALAKDANGQLVYNDDGQTITKTYSLADDNIPALAADADKIASGDIASQRYLNSETGQRFHLFHAPVGNNGYTLGLVVGESSLIAPLVSFLWLISIFVLSLVVVLVAAYFWHRKNIAEPLTSLMNYIRQLRDGKYDEPVQLATGDELGQVAATLGEMSRAIIEREGDLRESEVRFECAMAGTNDGLWDWDLHSGKIYFSPRWCEMLGYSHEDVMPEFDSFLKLLHPDDTDYCDNYVKAFLTGNRQRYHLTFRMRHKNGSTVHVLSRASLVRDEVTGQAIRLIGTHVDISDDKVYEEKIKQLNAELEQRVHERTQELEEANQALEEMTLLDSLTQVGNRRAMEADMKAVFSAYRRYQRKYSLLLLDIDYFKPYNDFYGHPQGDEVLRHVARLLKGSIRDVDHLYRYGGEEFLILMPDTEIDMAILIAERARANIALVKIPHCESPLETLSVSIGVAINHEDDQGCQTAIKRADENLYRAKDGGRNKVVHEQSRGHPKITLLSSKKNDKKPS